MSSSRTMVRSLALALSLVVASALQAQPKTATPPKATTTAAPKPAMTAPAAQKAAPADLVDISGATRTMLGPFVPARPEAGGER